LKPLDHLVYVAFELERAVDDFERRFGVRASPGGRHPGAGTHNALLSLGGDAYLEIIAPDPLQPAPGHPRSFGLDSLRAPRLQTWAVKHADLEELLSRALALGIDLERVESGFRRRPDGGELSWRYAGIPADRLGGVIPFFIDWGVSAHPSSSAAPGLRFVGLRAEHPDPDRARALLEGLGIGIDVTRGPEAALIATLGGPHGELELR